MKGRRKVYDFGFDPAEGPHHFQLVDLGRDGVTVYESFLWDEGGGAAAGHGRPTGRPGRADDHGGPAGRSDRVDRVADGHRPFPVEPGPGPVLQPRPKAMLDPYRWSRIAPAAAAEFNARLRRMGRRPAKWKRETLLAPYFGKELVLLMWAVEDADPAVIPNVLANWSGFAPEERWWLYTTVNATAGHPEHGKDRGWRKAIRIALAENPTQDPPPSALRDLAPLLEAGTRGG